MRLAIHNCKHCGTEYTHQWSGNYDAVDTPKELRDKDYCPDCKKVVNEALLLIPKKFDYKFVDTDEVDLDTLLRWEKEEAEEFQIKQESNMAGFMLPRMKRVFPSLVSHDLKESMKTEQVIGREDKKGRKYIYSYWPSKPEQAKIRVEKYVNLITGEEVKYRLDN